MQRQWKSGKCSETQMFTETVLVFCYICLLGFIAALRLRLCDTGGGGL